MSPLPTSARTRLCGWCIFWDQICLVICWLRYICFGTVGLQPDEPRLLTGTIMIRKINRSLIENDRLRLLDEEALLLPARLVPPSVQFTFQHNYNIIIFYLSRKSFAQDSDLGFALRRGQTAPSPRN